MFWCIFLHLALLNHCSQYVQLIIVPIVFTLVGFIGIACTSAGYVHYGQYYWCVYPPIWKVKPSTHSLLYSRDPLELIDHWDNRPAAFFASAALALATICTNISANSFSAATDLTALFPRVGPFSAKLFLRPFAHRFLSI